jgi:hypothetical protein
MHRVIVHSIQRLQNPMRHTYSQIALTPPFSSERLSGTNSILSLLFTNPASIPVLSTPLLLHMNMSSVHTYAAARSRRACSCGQEALSTLRPVQPLQLESVRKMELLRWPLPLVSSQQ